MPKASASPAAGPARKVKTKGVVGAALDDIFADKELLKSSDLRADGGRADGTSSNATWSSKGWIDADVLALFDDDVVRMRDTWGWKPKEERPKLTKGEMRQKKRKEIV